MYIISFPVSSSFTCKIHFLFQSRLFADFISCFRLHYDYISFPVLGSLMCIHAFNFLLQPPSHVKLTFCFSLRYVSYFIFSFSLCYVYIILQHQAPLFVYFISCCRLHNACFISCFRYHYKHISYFRFRYVYISFPFAVFSTYIYSQKK